MKSLLYKKKNFLKLISFLVNMLENYFHFHMVQRVFRINNPATI